MKRKAIAILLICCIAVACLIAAGHLTKQDQEGQQASEGPLQIRFIPGGSLEFVYSKT